METQGLEEYILICNNNLLDAKRGEEGKRYLLNRRKFEWKGWKIDVSMVNENKGVSKDAIYTCGLMELIPKFKIGFDPSFSMNTNGEIWQALIIPTSKSSFVARNINAEDGAQNRYVRVGEFPFFNIDALNGMKHVYITKGEIDALSIMACDESVSAVSLGGLNNAEAFLQYIDEYKITPQAQLIIALDNTENGKIVADKLFSGLKERNISVCRADLYGGYIDANHAMSNSNELSLSSLFNNIEHEEERLSLIGDREEARIQYLLENACSHKIPVFMERIKLSRNAPSVSTGFSKLDEALGGGLFEGLYILGGLSSLGKTALVLQIADNLAKSGHDVMFFALEMSTDELIARSLSREVYNAKSGEMTTRDILSGKYEDKQEMFDNALHEYGAYNQRLFFFDQSRRNFFNIGNIKEAVSRHVMIMHSSPVLIVDYLQIIKSSDDKRDILSDKQTVDENVLGLKNISKEFHIPVIAVSSLNRASYGKEISQEAFKESGSIEYVCDGLIGLQFTDKSDINKAKAAEPRNIEVLILKHRNGKVGEKINFQFAAKNNSFQEVN